MFLYPLQLTHPCFHPPYAFFVFWSMTRIFLLIHSGLLPFLPDFLYTSVDHSWNWRRWPLNIKNISWVPLSSTALSHRIFVLCLRRPKALLTSRVVSLIFTLLLPLRILSSTISWSLQSRMTLTFTSPVCLSFFHKYEASYKRPLLG